MKHGIIRVTAFSPDLVVGNPPVNARAIAAGIHRYAREGSHIIVTPELSLTGYTLGDLTLQDALLSSAERALGEVLVTTEEDDVLFTVGLPVALGGRVYSAAAVCKGDAILGVVAKRVLSAGEARLFAPAPAETEMITLCGQEVPFGGVQVFAADNVPNLIVGVEFGEEAFSAAAPHSALVGAGATVILNMAATPTVCGEDKARVGLVKAISRVTQAAYVYADARDESTTDYVFGGQRIIAEYGEIKAQAAPFAEDDVSALVDVNGVVYRRRLSRVDVPMEGATCVEFTFAAVRETHIGYVNTHPFVPETEDERAALATELIALQAQGLAARVRRIGVNKLVLGVSGGLDSTLALLVCHKACSLLGWVAAEHMVCVTLPCFGTTDRTKNNATELCEALGIPCREINIAKAVTQHLEDIGHDPQQLDVAFENAQARMRTLVLMDVANAEGGIVVGTGDLSEIALGWCTYNGDHMSMYNVNGTVPKTLIQCVVRELSREASPALANVLTDILATPISPELIPHVGGQIVQKTEELVGRYEINDFILYYMMKYGAEPSKIMRYAQAAFPQVKRDELKKAFERFYTRFFSQQFKRSCSVDGAKVGAVDLSPRGEWQMPSDITAATWLADLHNID